MKQKIINENNNGWNGNNQNPWGQNNNRQNFENPFDGLQKIISKFLPGGGKGWKGLFAVLLIFQQILFHQYCLYLQREKFEYDHLYS